MIFLLLLLQASTRLFKAELSHEKYWLTKIWMFKKAYLCIDTGYPWEQSHIGNLRTSTVIQQTPVGWKDQVPVLLTL